MVFLLAVFEISSSGFLQTFLVIFYYLKSQFMVRPPETGILDKGYLAVGRLSFLTKFSVNIKQ